MKRTHRRVAIGAIGFSVFATLALGGTTYAQGIRGFDNKADALPTGVERKAQSDLWVLEVNYKSLRMISVDITDKKTGTKKRELVWYLCYQALRREIEQQQDASDTSPLNIFDPPPTNPTTGKPSEPMFVPEFTLVAIDNGVQKIYPDQILPEVQAAIIARERQDFRNSVEIVGPVPLVTPAAAKKLNAVYGVVTWRGIDPETDHFTVFMTGFSNGYKLVLGPVSYQDLSQLVADGKLRISDQVWTGKGNWQTAGQVGNLFDPKKQPPANAAEEIWYYTTSTDRLGDGPLPQVWRKTLIQQYWRPGDRFDENETEFRQEDPKGNAYEPTWIYRPDDVAFRPIAKPAGTKPAAKQPVPPNKNAAKKPAAKKPAAKKPAAKNPPTAPE